MHWRTTRDHWGWLSIAIHWLTALAVFSLFGLGLWMTELDYYDPWYRKGPDSVEWEAELQALGRAVGPGDTVHR